MAKEITPLENLQLLVGKLNKEQLLSIIQSYLDDNLQIVDSLNLNNQCLNILNEKLKEFA